VQLSRLGITEEGAHLVIMPEDHVSVEVQVYLANELVATRRLRVSGILRLVEVGKILEKELHERPPEGCTSISGSHVEEWCLCNPSESATSQGVSKGAEKVSVSSPRSGVVAAVSSAAAAVKRKSFGGGGSRDSSARKKRRSLGSAPELTELSADDFVSDLHAVHSRGPQTLSPQFLCPISYDVMRDPIVVSGSGNTYDRKSIERHFQLKHTDPISNLQLRRASERRLVPNNALRSQVHEAERSQVDLQLIAFLGEDLQRSLTGDGMGSYLRRFASVFGQ
jgi:hypothetical protein